MTAKQISEITEKLKEKLEYLKANPERQKPYCYVNKKGTKQFPLEDGSILEITKTK